MGKSISGSAKPSSRTYDMLEEMVRLKAQEYIQDILEEEVEEFLGRRKCERKKFVDGSEGYRNGYGKPKKFALMNGTITVQRPRVRDTEERFESRIMPFFKRRSKEVGDLLPELYLHGLAKGDFELALRGLLGAGAPLSASAIDRLKGKWQMEYAEWRGRDLSNLEVVYQWADGIYVKAGIEKDKAALLVMIGALTNGKKVFLACESGYRESKESWSGVLRDLTARGLKLGSLTIADGHLGIWSALGEIHPKGNEQRCWNHIAGRDPHFHRGETSPTGQILMNPVAWGRTWRGNLLRRSRPDIVVSEPSPEARAKPRAATKVNVFGAVMASWTDITGRVREWGGRVSCVLTKTATTADAWGKEAVVAPGV
ncbi:MAG TPA: hypothetical protein DCP92_12160 [Nitrospiraceae bacterium]|nr:hypothetical protein [Nitrospiraceae bacterium]